MELATLATPQPPPPRHPLCNHTANHVSQAGRGAVDDGPRRLLRRALDEDLLIDTLLDRTVRVTHRPGSGPGRHAYQKAYKKEPFPLDGGCIVTFEANFERGFEWGCRGKVGGLFVGTGPADDGEHSRRGASLRLMWDEGGGAYAYVYVPSGTYDDQPSPLDERVDSGQSLFKDDFKRALAGAGWHTVTLGLKLNSVGRRGRPNADGQLLFGIDGVERTMSDVVWRVDDDLQVEQFVLSVFHGGGCRARRTSHSNYRNVRVYRWE